ncbi:hypothetical protein DY048_04090 [Apilactobacillus timberlakei]|uniref:Uncharacterized protein n=1 Tax=Apilactobacillus timberlakei TaxID=2008380 RepID=A0ABY2YWP0_9LACO|nr:hypothetical protein DYZ97_04135 [Apilactobacillus timberlakei]TPR14133.1 hypothetical protein DY048_04090 [Apilactobacillus timberlakei]TPR16387.1 hypothetical protein DY052_02185 [Apilactobacillus timberlakei]
MSFPYNNSFLQSNKGLYYYKLINEIFKDYHIFKLSPLRFGSNKQIKYWKKYYKKIGLSLLQYELGSSHNLLAGNDKLKFV